jgi:hypothetical protein
MAKNGSARSRQTENHPDAHTLIRAILTILRDSTSGNLYVYLISKKWIHCSNHKCQSERVREKNIACFRSANIGLTASQRKRMSVCMQAQELITEDPDMKIPEKMIALSILVALGILPQAAGAQTRDFAATTTAETSTVASRQTYPNYVRPTTKTMAENYAFDTFGPYPIVGAAAAAGINQWTNSPPEWKQGAEAYGKRFGSNFGIAAVSTTTRFALSAAFKEDSLYYRCECSGVLPRLSHAVISTVTARRGQDGHRVFSVAALVSPYVGTTTAIYGWYPDRFGAKDAFRMGNYNLLIGAGGNVAIEFIFSGRHSLLSRMHLNSRHGAQDSGPNN